MNRAWMKALCWFALITASIALSTSGCAGEVTETVEETNPPQPTPEPMPEPPPALELILQQATPLLGEEVEINCMFSNISSEPLVVRAFHKVFSRSGVTIY